MKNCPDKNKETAGKKFIDSNGESSQIKEENNG